MNMGQAISQSVWVAAILLVYSGAALGAGARAGDREHAAESHANGFATPRQQPVTVELVAEHTSIQPGGKTRVGVHFEIEEGWHIYAKNPGDAGLPTTVKWVVPRGVTMDPLQYPSPKRFVDPGDIHTFGYADNALLWSRVYLIKGKPEALGPVFVVRADVEWLACKEVCLPGKANLELTLPISAAPPTLSTHATLFEQVKH